MKYTPEQAAEIINRLGSRGGMQAGLLSAAMYLKGKVAEYPPAMAKKPKYIWENEDERRTFFARLRKGEIEVPYRRGLSPGSETMSKRWSVRPEHGGVTIRNNASYAAKVIGPQSQKLYMKKLGWKSVDKVAKAEREEIVNQFLTALSQYSKDE